MSSSPAMYSTAPRNTIERTIEKDVQTHCCRQLVAEAWHELLHGVGHRHRVRSRLLLNREDYGALTVGIVSNLF